MDHHLITERDKYFLRRAFRHAIRAEKDGHLPIGAVLTLDDEIIAEAGNAVIQADGFHPISHAEKMAVDQLLPAHFARSKDITCYATLEPCCMCYSKLLLARIGKIIYAGADPYRPLSAFITGYHQTGYTEAQLPELIGPVYPEMGERLYERISARYQLHRPEHS